MSTSVPRRDELDTDNLPGKRPATRQEFYESLRLHEKDLYKAAWALCDRSDGIESLLELAVVSSWKERSHSSLDELFRQQLARKLIECARAISESVPTSAGRSSVARAEVERQSSRPSAQVRRALSSLPWECREIFVLRDLMNFSAKECAKILRISQDDARRLIAQARLGMMQELSIPKSIRAAGGGR